MGLFRNSLRKLAVKSTIRNAHGLSRSLAKAFAAAKLYNPDNSYNDNLKLALQARPGWIQMDDHTFVYKTENVSISDNATLKDIAIMVSDSELRHGGRDIPLDELTTLQIIAQQEIEKCFEVS